MPARREHRGQRLCGRPESSEGEAGEFPALEVQGAPIRALWPNRLRIKVCREDAQHPVNVRQIRPVLIDLALQLNDDAGEFGLLGNQTRDDLRAFRLSHAAALSQYLHQIALGQSQSGAGDEFQVRAVGDAAVVLPPRHLVAYW